MLDLKDDPDFAARVEAAKRRRLGQPASREGLCLVIGILLSLVGAYFLTVPSGGAADFMGRSVDVVNLHRLYLGQTSAIVGAMFIVAAVRPR
jgi:hypothetical protein